MQDGTIMGTGNSRYLKSISGFLSLYPTYESFAQALAAGTLPIDWNGKNPDGWAQQGTPLNKANLLTDATAALVGLGDESSVNDMLAVLANKASAAEDTAEDLEALRTRVGGLISYGTAALTPGSSSLATGSIYIQYE